MGESLLPLNHKQRPFVGGKPRVDIYFSTFFSAER